jgi:hypothetical protein
MTLSERQRSAAHASQTGRERLVVHTFELFQQIRFKLLRLGTYERCTL